MRYFLVPLLLSALWQAILATGLQTNPVFYDLERRLVRLEDRQFSESQNLEHRMLQMEAQLGIPQEDENSVSIQMESNTYQVYGAEAIKKPSTDNLKLVERLEKIEKNWERELEEQLVKFSSKYDNLAERFSAIEKQVKERQWMEDSLGNFIKIGSKYYLIEQENTLSWQGALGKCSELNAELASLQSEKEWSALRDHLDPDKSYWVDVNDIQNEGLYVSGMTGRKATFLMWEAREPNHLTTEMGGEDCVELRRDYDHYMNDIHCSQENFYICELKTDF